MENMKRILALIIVFVMLSALVSCSDDVKTETENTENANVTEDAITDDGAGNEKTEPDGGYTPLFWKVTDSDGDEIYLFGTIHVGRKDFFPLPEYVTEAFTESDVLAVEFDITEFEKDVQAAVDAYSLGLYTDGTLISDHVDSELYTDAKDILSENGVYVQTMDYFMPFFWADTISSLLVEKTDFNIDNGVDRYLIKEAKKLGMTVTDVESAELQISIEAGFSEDLQKLLLKTAVDEYADADSYNESLKELADAWYEGDGDTILGEETEVDEEYADYENYTELLEEYEKAMLTDRNIGMADFCEEALENSEKVFFCVGCAHFLGDDGIVELLRTRGYTVELVGDF